MLAEGSMRDTCHSDGSTPETDCKLCHLDGICQLGNLTDEQSGLFAQSIAHMEPLKEGEYIFQQGDEFNSLYIVRTGSAKSFITTSDGQEQIVGFNFPGEILGMDAFDNQKHNSSAQALEPLSLCRFSPDSFDMLSQVCPNFYSFCFSTFSKELIHIHEMVRAMGQKGIEEKLAMFLLGISIRMQELGYSGKEFNLSMSRNDIANFLGVASETVSREFTQLQKEGVLQVDRRWVCIESMESLETMAE